MSRAAEIAKRIVDAFVRTVDGYDAKQAEGAKMADALREFWHASFLEALPPHEAGLSISHNPHKNSYESVREYVKFLEDDFVSDEERERAYATGEFWELQWYPDTPVDFHRRFASSLEAVLKGPGR